MVKASLFDGTHNALQWSIFPGGHENLLCLLLIPSLEQRPTYAEMGGKKAPLERLRGVSHLENEWSRQAFSMGHTTRCSGQYSPGDTKTALVFGCFTHWNRGLNMKGFFKRKKSTSREIAGCVTP